jgi:hypothetical protein
MLLGARRVAPSRVAGSEGEAKFGRTLSRMCDLNIEPLTMHAMYAPSCYGGKHGLPITKLFRQYA